jgi:8-oxo-dGTP diphosphatase
MIISKRIEKEPALPEFGTRVPGIDYIERPGVYAVIENRHNQIAVIKTKTGYFLPGGGVDPGETGIEALHREIMEETGCQVSVSAEIGEAVEYINAQAEGKHYRIHGKFYKIQIDSHIGEGMEEDHQLVWLSQEDAFNLLVRRSQAWAIQWMARGQHR